MPDNVPNNDWAALRAWLVNWSCKSCKCGVTEPRRLEPTDTNDDVILSTWPESVLVIPL